MQTLRTNAKESWKCIAWRQTEGSTFEFRLRG
jgi:hypothetical protein